MSDRTKPCDSIWRTETGNHGCQFNEGHGGPHRCCSCSATLFAPVEPPVLSRQFLDSLIDTYLEEDDWPEIKGARQLRDAILETE